MLNGSESTPVRRSPNIHDVAAALGMHKSTVSLALSGKGNVSEKTRARVMAVAKDLGYEPNPLAQRLANGVNNSLVCLCSGGLDVGITTEKVLLIQKELSRASWEAPIYTFSELSGDGARSQAQQIKQLCRQQPRAIVCAAHSLNSLVFHELQCYQQDGGIVVTYDVEVPMECDQVVFDREDNACRAAQHLIDLGHRHIGLGLSNSSMFPVGDTRIARNTRIHGFHQALEGAGIEVRPDWIMQHSTYEIGGAEMARHFLALKERPTGMCIVNDYVALAFMVEVMQAGVRIPEELSIVGHDNQPVASYCPVPLTSMTQPVEQIAHTVVELLTERLQGGKHEPRKVEIRGELVQRASSVAPVSKG